LSLDRLTSEDAAILDLESATIAGHTCKVLRLGGTAPTVAELREHVAARLDGAPRLRRRLAPTPLGLAPPAWVDDEDFDLARHIRRLPSKGPVDEAELRELTARAMEQRLDRAHPLWSLDVAEELAGGGSALILKVHHALADGTEVMRLCEVLLWGEEATPASTRWEPEAAPGSLGLLAAAARDRAGALAGGAAGAARGLVSPSAWRGAAAQTRRLPGALARELRPTEGPSPLDAPVGTRRAVAFASLPLETLKRIEHAQAERTTVNDVLLALVAGALQRWTVHHGLEPHALNVKIPVSLHDRHAHPDALANRDSFLCVGLPLSEPEPLARLNVISAETRLRKREHDAQALDALFGELRHAPRPVARFAARLAGGPRVFALNVSNVPGPREPRGVLGTPVAAMHSLAEIGRHHALRISAVSLAGTLYVGLTADGAAVEDLDVLAAGLEAEVAELERACGREYN
jgi:diacylglycerol O-acyltransferase / wax synthase